MSTGRKILAFHVVIKTESQARDTEGQTMSDLDSDSDLSVASGFENEEPGSGFENEVPGSPFTDIDEAITDEGEMVQEIFNFEYSNQCFVMSSLLAVEFVAGSRVLKFIGGCAKRLILVTQPRPNPFFKNMFKRYLNLCHGHAWNRFWTPDDIWGITIFTDGV